MQQARVLLLIPSTEKDNGSSPQRLQPMSRLQISMKYILPVKEAISDHLRPSSRDMGEKHVPMRAMQQIPQAEPQTIQRRRTGPLQKHSPATKPDFVYWSGRKGKTAPLIRRL